MIWTVRRGAQEITAAGEDVAAELAAIGAPVCPGELGDPDAVQAMLADLRDLGHIDDYSRTG